MTKALQTKQGEAPPKITTIRDLFEKNRKALEDALPKHIGVERFLRVALTTVQRTPRLMHPKTDPRSLLGALVEAAQLGLMIDSTLGEAYLVPYWNSKRECFEVQFQPGYRGYCTLARRSGQVSNIFSRIVFLNEKFKLVQGDTPRILHTPLPPSQRGEERVGAYAVVVMKDKTRQTEWMWEEEIMAIRARSKAKDEGPWKDTKSPDADEMRKKTTIRRIAKVLPLSPEWSRAAAIDEAREAGIRVLPEIDFGLHELDVGIGNGGYNIIGNPEALEEGKGGEAEQAGKGAPEKTGEGEQQKKVEASAEDIDKMSPGELLARLHGFVQKYAELHKINAQDAIEKLKGLAGIKAKGALKAESIRKLYIKTVEVLKDLPAGEEDQDLGEGLEENPEEGPEEGEKE